MLHRCRHCIIDNVAFAKENTSENFQAIKNRNLTLTATASREADRENNISIHQHQKPPVSKVGLKLGENKQKITNKQKNAYVEA